MGEPRPAARSSATELAHAKALIEKQDFKPAIALFESLLVSDLPVDLASEVQTNLAAALCTIAQGEGVPHDLALTQLEQARVLLSEALLHYQPMTAPREWASARANLALVYLARHRLSGSDNDVLQAHMALDGTEPALLKIDDVDTIGWIQAIRDYLLDMRERRSKRR